MTIPVLKDDICNPKPNNLHNVYLVSINNKTNAKVPVLAQTWPDIPMQNSVGI